MTTSPASLRLAFTAAMFGMAGSMLFQTLLATALPQITRELGDVELYPWVMGGYLAASTVVIPFAGPIADRLGPRPVHVAGTTVFLIGAGLAAVAPSMAALVAARTLQGLAAGAIVPAAMGVLGMMPDDRARGRAFGTFGAVGVVATLVGPLIGGWFADGPGWRWGILVSSSTIAVGLVLAVIGMPKAPERPPRWWRVRVADSLAPASRPELRPLLIAATLVGAMTMSATTYLPLALAILHGLSSTATGTFLLPMLVATALGSAVGGRLVTRPAAAWAPWIVPLVGLPIALANTPAALSAAGVLMGLAMGSALPNLLTRVQGLSAPDQRAATGSLVQLARNLGGAVSVPVLGLWVTTGLPTATGFVALTTSLWLVSLAGLVISWRAR
ncbi:MAG: MFS transporter [Dermatophilus congolensis]|nr:MFS transporter [Dermatophilus congolensis]